MSESVRRRDSVRRGLHTHLVARRGLDPSERNTGGVVGPNLEKTLRNVTLVWSLKAAATAKALLLA